MSADPDGNSPSVSVGDHQSPADDDDVSREREETKRLLYVAMTRARDRLYLASALRDGRLQPGRGSLAEVLPASLVAQLAGGTLPSIEWRASSGVTHSLRVCQAEPGTVQSHPSREEALSATPTDYGPLPSGSAVHPPQTSAATDAVGATASGSGTPSDRIVGNLVHRLLARIGFGATLAAACEAAPRLVRQEEALDVHPAVIEAAIEAYRAISTRDDVRSLYAAGRVLHEMPFTMPVDGAWIRGTIDCVVCLADRTIVLEFKTGRHRPQHREQAEIYRRAAVQLFPGLAAEALLVYAGDATPAGSGRES